MHRRPDAARGAATRVLLALVAIVGCLAGAVAYAAAGPGMGGEDASPAGDGLARSRPAPGGARPPRPLIAKHPEATSTSSTASFSFRAPRGTPRFQCRLDGGGWKRCSSPLAYRGLAPGQHGFSVRAVSRQGRRSAATRFRWRLLEPKPFSVEPRLDLLGPLFPGAPAQALPVVLTNPNPVRILITSLTVAATGDPPGCHSAANLELFSSSLSPAAPLALPAEGSVSLPAAGVSPPAIALRDLPVSQDACQGARFPLAFSGEAHG
jgi:hypothetical protein